MALIDLKDLTLSLGGPLILNGVNLRIEERDRISLVGRNGTGKSTLLRIMAGIDTDILGEARPQPGINIGFLQQEPELDAYEDLELYIMMWQKLQIILGK